MRGDVRSQFSHAVDMMPTLLELAGVDADGRQLDGKSLVPAFADRSFEQPRTQYFEILGSRSVYRDGWKVTTDHVISGAGAESELLEGSRDYDADHWNLFDLRRDFSESTDLSAEEPQLVESMIATWWEEAERNSVLPLVEGSFADMINASQEADSDGEPRTAYVYRPHTAPVHEDVCPNFAGGFSLTAEFDNGHEVPAGVICAQGDWNNGWALYAKDGRLHYALCRVGRLHLVSSRELDGPIVSLGMWYEPAARRRRSRRAVRERDHRGRAAPRRPRAAALAVRRFRPVHRLRRGPTRDRRLPAPVRVHRRARAGGHRGPATRGRGHPHPAEAVLRAD